MAMHVSWAQVGLSWLAGKLQEDESYFLRGFCENRCYGGNYEYEWIWEWGTAEELFHCDDVYLSVLLDLLKPLA